LEIPILGVCKIFFTLNPISKTQIFSVVSRFSQLNVLSIPKYLVTLPGQEINSRSSKSKLDIFSKGNILTHLISTAPGFSASEVKFKQ